MKTRKTSSIAALVTFCALYLGALAPVSFGASAALERQVGQELSRELRPVIANFLTQQTAQPRVPFRLQVKAELRGPNSNARLHHVVVRARVKPLAEHPALDVDLKSYLQLYLERSGYVSRPKEFEPTYLAEVSYLPGYVQKHPYLDGAAQVLFALVCLLLLFSMRRRKRRQAYEWTEEYEDMVLGGDDVEAQAARLNEKMTPELQELLHHHSPQLGKQGSWYLYALKDTPPEDLRQKFSDMSLDESLILMRHLTAAQRNRLVKSLELRPAIRTRIDEFITSNGRV